MKKNKTFLIGLSAAAIAFIAGIYSHQRTADNLRETPPALAPESIGRFFSNTLNDASGKTQAFAQWQEKTLVINFWATWCPPCREEMPAFSRLQAKYAANGVQFVGIALDSEENVADFARRFPVIYPLLIGESKGADLARQLGNLQLALPYTVIIGSDGEARFARLGGVSEQELDALLQRAVTR